MVKIHGENPRLGCKRLFATVYHAERSKLALWPLLIFYCIIFFLASFYKGNNPIYEGSTLIPNYLPKALPPNTFTSGNWISTQEFWGGHKHLFHNKLFTYLYFISTIKFHCCSCCFTGFTHSF